ncbi:MAG: PilN domain-containing protein, partial [Thermohalobaculum sp.]|nr:PilN domain-containing protein [Thermohalobaculum sp.]
LGFVATAVLALGLLVVPLHRAGTRLAEAEEAAQSARQAAVHAEALSRRIEALAARETALVDRRRTEPRALDHLAEVTRLLPDGSYLIQMTLAGGKLSMTGYAARATPLLGIVERSDRFAAARFTEPVLPDARMGAERFAIAADLAGPRPNAETRP